MPMSRITPRPLINHSQVRSHDPFDMHYLMQSLTVLPLPVTGSPLTAVTKLQNYSWQQLRSYTADHSFQAINPNGEMLGVANAYLRCFQLRFLCLKTPVLYEMHQIRAMTLPTSKLNWTLHERERIGSERLATPLPYNSEPYRSITNRTSLGIQYGPTYLSGSSHGSIYSLMRAYTHMNANTVATDNHLWTIYACIKMFYEINGTLDVQNFGVIRLVSENHLAQHRCHSAQRHTNDHSFHNFLSKILSIQRHIAVQIDRLYWEFLAYITSIINDRWQLFLQILFSKYKNH